MNLLFATNNAHKLEEVNAMLSGGDFSVQGMTEAGFELDPPETGDSFEENALQKARFVFNTTGRPTLADDSGLVVDFLGGAPGIHSKRFSKEGTAKANNLLLLHKLAGANERQARFVCVLAFVWSGGERLVRGECEGLIGHSHRGTDGFGYDPLFWPLDYPGRAMAELTMSEKNKISHRGRAFSRLPELLEGLV